MMNNLNTIDNLSTQLEKKDQETRYPKDQIQSLNEKMKEISEKLTTMQQSNIKHFFSWFIFILSLLTNLIIITEIKTREEFKLEESILLITSLPSLPPLTVGDFVN